MDLSQNNRQVLALKTSSYWRQTQNLYLLSNLEMSIRCSKQLRRALPRILSKDYDNNVFEEMCAIKQIPQTQAK